MDSGSVGVAITLPWLLVALPAGAVVDRADRRAAMIAADGARIAVLAALAVLLAAGQHSIALLCAAALLLGTAETVHDTAGQALLPQVVDRQALVRANSRLQAVQLTANQFAGPPLGGLLVAIGPALAFATPAGLWAAALGLLLLLRGRFRIARTTASTVRADITEGLRFLAAHRVLRSLAAMTGVINLAISAVFAVFVLYAVGPRSALRLSQAGYGLLFAITAVGSVLGALAGERLQRRLGFAPTMLVSIVLSGASLAVPALTGSVAAIAVGFLAGGVGIGLYNVAGVSLRQRLTPDRMLGRVTSNYRLVAWGAQPAGAALGGLLAQAVGLRWLFGTAATVAVLTAIGVTQLTAPRIRAAETAAGTS